MNNYFEFGSSIYGNDKPNDIDMYSFRPKTFEVANDSKFEIHHITYDEFIERLEACDIVMIEGYSLQYHSKFKDCHDLNIPRITFDKSKLRSSISQTASNSFVKAKKKLTVEKDYNRTAAMKSLFHCLRIIMFGKQIGYQGYIYDFSAANDLYVEIKNDFMYNDNDVLELIDTKYKKIKNTLMSEFRRIAPK